LSSKDIRLILTDMDGTLLSPDLTVSEANRKAILDARAAGIETAIATGRLDLLVQDYVKQLDIRGRLSPATERWCGMWRGAKPYTCGRSRTRPQLA
jgi:hydroxymethylpyrimidine pyrophosphatase-like HAD family hydrolase